MGLFEDLGKKVEQFKQQAESASQEQANRKCAECGTLVYTDREDCPDCGGERFLVRKGSAADSDPESPSESAAESESTTGPDGAGSPLGNEAVDDGSDRSG